jgi:U3 small nucleolar RNA-associated protein 12
MDQRRRSNSGGLDQKARYRKVWKRKRRREKAMSGAAEGEKLNDDLDNTEENTENISSAGVNEVFVPYVIVRTGGKVRSVDWAEEEQAKLCSYL